VKRKPGFQFFEICHIADITPDKKFHKRRAGISNRGDQHRDNGTIDPHQQESQWFGRNKGRA
jgi:hypothetical protein